MLPRLNNRPASQLYTLQPGYDPLIEYDACGTGSRGDRRAVVPGVPKASGSGEYVALVPPAIPAGGPVGYSVSGADPSRIASSTVMEVSRRAVDLGSSTQRPPNGGSPANGAKTRSPRCQHPLVIAQ
jgi:hypothetical protein